jgi:hypothetical protein
MDPHLIHIPRLTPFTAGRLSSRHLERFGGEPHGALDTQVLGLGALQELSANFF